MKPYLYLLTALLVALCWTCNDRSTITLPESNTPTGKVSLSLAKGLAGVAQVVARLSRESFNDLTLQLTVSDTGQTASGSFTSVPTGVWHLKVEALDDSGAIRYSGQADVTVQPGMTSLVRLQLLPAEGGIEIEVNWGGACALVPPGAVSWWPAEDAVNDLIGSNPGELVHGASFANGVVGKAFNLDGKTGYVRIPDSPSLNPEGSFTLEAWILPTADTRASIISKWGDTSAWANQRAYVFEIMPGRNLLFGISDTAHETDGGFHEFSTWGGVLTLYSWNHVAAVYDHSTGKRMIYANGIEVAERTDFPIKVGPSMADFTIGVDLRSPETTYPYFFPDESTRWTSLIDRLHPAR